MSRQQRLVLAGLMTVCCWNLRMGPSLPAAMGREPGWPGLPPRDGEVSVPAQEWPLRPGPRSVPVWVYYPGGALEKVDAQTGIMLSLHNWGGTRSVGTADPRVLAQRLNVVALCVDYLQSGKPSIEGPEPYDFGYLQALDALRTLYFVYSELQAAGRPFASGRIYTTGGSGGGNVSLMANKLAPRTFACIIDMCGMVQLTDDVAFNLPGGSSLNARYTRDPKSPYYLSPDAQQLRSVGHPDHLATMRRLGSGAKIVVVHGVEDKSCPVGPVREMVENMRSAGLDVEPHFITREDLDGRVFTSAGHALGNRTEIVLNVAGPYLTPGGPQASVRRGPSDFELRDTAVRYRTPNGQYVISYEAGYPVGRFEPGGAPGK